MLILITGSLACATSPKPLVRSAALPAGEGAAPAVEAPRPKPPAERSGLQFDVQPAGAQVVVDGRAVGTAGSLREAGGLLALPPGIHQVSIRHPGYVTWRAEVTVGEAAEPIRVTLAPGP